MSNEAAAPAAPIENNTPQAEQVQPQKPIETVDKFASKFAALTRKEREFNERQKAKESEYTSKLKEIEEKQKKFGEYENLDKELSSDKRKALEFLTKKGITLDDLSNLLVDELNPDPETKIKRYQSESENRLLKKIEELEQKLTADEQRKKTESEEQAKAQHEKVVQKVVGDLTEFVNSNDDYTLIKNYNSVEMVYELMSTHYQEQVNKGVPDQMIKLLTYKEACDAVEAHLDEEVSKTYEAKRAKQAPKKEEVKDTKTTQTLSNTMSSEVPKSGEVKYKSNEESIKEAAKLLRFLET